KQLNPQAQDPKDTDLDAIIQKEMAKIRGQVKPLVAAADETQVEVNWFYDSMLAAGGPGSAPATGATGGSSRAGAGDGVMSMLKEFGPQAGLGLIALLSLGIVLRLARRAQSAIESASPSAAKAAARTSEEPGAEHEVEQLEMDTGPVGEALMSEAVLEGREV